MPLPHAALADAIHARRSAIGHRSIEHMYAEDPFWEARFGMRGRRFAEEDGGHHVDHLVAALREGSSRRFVQYARWLQVVLTTRGMCTRHVERNFRTLAEALAVEAIPDAGPALDYLDEGARALRHESRPAAVLEESAAAIVARVAVALRAAHPEWPHWHNGARASRLGHETDTLVSFLADAVQMARPELFNAHVAWMTEDAARRGEPAGFVDALLGAMASSLDALSHLDAPADRALLHAMLDAARAGDAGGAARA